VTANGQVRGGAYAQAIAVLSPTEVADAGARIARRVVDRAQRTDEETRDFITRDRAALDRESLAALREYAELLNALKEVRT